MATRVYPVKATNQVTGESVVLAVFSSQRRANDYASRKRMSYIESNTPNTLTILQYELNDESLNPA